MRARALCYAAAAAPAARIFSSNLRVDAKDKGIIYLGVLFIDVVCRRPCFSVFLAGAVRR